MAITIVVDRGLCPWRIFKQKDIILFLGQVEGRLEGVTLKDEWRGGMRKEVTTPGQMRTTEA